METKIKSLHDGNEVSLTEVLKVRTNAKYRVGCDSINTKDTTIFITTLIGIHPNRSGAFILYQKEKIPKIRETQIRLWQEVEKAIAFATLLKKQYLVDIECIDFDLNPNLTYESSRLVSSAVGYAEAMGFKAVCKPHSIYAIHAADFIAHKSSEHFKRKGIDT